MQLKNVWKASNKEIRVIKSSNNGLSQSLHKICENTGFNWSVFSPTGEYGLVKTRIPAYFMQWIIIGNWIIGLSQAREKSNVYCCLRVSPDLLLTHFSPVPHFYTPWKHQKTKRFLTFSGGIVMWNRTKMG